MSGSSYNPQEDLLNWLKAHLPEVFKEGKIDCGTLKKTLGEAVSDENERYGLTWAGKSNCFRVIQEPTTATLKPVREESVNFDETENIFIEGDNLEVLKVLQKPYYGKVKMIYIDPPYNTGNDFIYNDSFKTSRSEYLEEAGETDENGNLRSDGLMKNSKDRGHYHSDWLNMMYPRLFLARNLLKEDGVIFVSIDDNEVKNLRAIMDEIFGEENFEGHIHWRRRHNQPNDPNKLIGLVAEHILVYAKNSAELKKTGVGKLELTGDFSNPDNDPRGEWNSKPWKTGSNQGGSKYKITLPDGTILDEEWMGDKKTYETLLADGRIYFPKNGSGFPRKKIFKSERELSGQSATNWFSHNDSGHNQEASVELAELFDDKKNIFDNPKPTKLIKKLIALGNLNNGEVILDFFAGSGTTAHAVMALNAEDGGDRKCISIQLAELCNEKSEAHKTGFKTIAEISKERIRRAGKKIAETVSEKRGYLNGLREVYGYKKREINEVQGDMDKPAYDFDFGFKVFKLDGSNFKIWESQIEDAEKLVKQMDIFVDNGKGKSNQEAVLYELIVKSGLDLNSKVENKGQFYSVNSGELIVCLAENVGQTLVDEILTEKPSKVLCLDSSFGGNDQLKTNTALQMESAGIEFKVI